MARDRVHPTKKLLLDTAVDLIDQFGPTGFTVEKLLDTSGISKGSLYHHYEDFDDLIDRAQIVRYARTVDEDIAFIVDAVRNSKTREEFFGRMRSLVTEGASETRIRTRANRAWIIGSSIDKPEFRRALSEEQKRLTDAFADLAREMQEKGWVSTKFSPLAISTFVQAYTLGRLVDDLAEEKVDREEWDELVLAAVSAIL